MINLQNIDELAQRLAALVPEGAREAKDELSAHFRETLRVGLRGLDLVTTEDFAVQRSVLLRTREKVEALEMQVAALERMVAASSGAAPKH